MNKDTREDKSVTPQHFEQIGRFVVGFEKVVERMRTGVVALFQTYGLESDELALAVTAGLSASDVLGILRSAFGTYLRHNPNLHLTRVAQVLFKRVQNLLQRRNELLHSFWQDEMSEGNDKPLGYRFVKTKEGLDVRNLPSLIELEKDVWEAIALSEMVHILICIPGRTDTPELYKAFKFDKDKNLYFDAQYAKSIGFI